MTGPLFQVVARTCTSINFFNFSQQKSLDENLEDKTDNIPRHLIIE